MTGPSSEDPSKASSSAPRQPPAPLMRMTLQGADLPMDSPEARDKAIEKAFDYRGDVTLVTTDGRTIEGYIFDRRQAGDESTLRVLTPDGKRQSLRYDEVAKLVISGRDTAEGRSWDTWVKKYVEKKLAGQSASIEPEKLD